MKRLTTWTSVFTIAGLAIALSHVYFFYGLFGVRIVNYLTIPELLFNLLSDVLPLLGLAYLIYFHQFFAYNKADGKVKKLAIGLNIFIIVFDVLLLYLARESEFLRWIVYANSVITTLLVMILAIASSTFFYAITYKFFQATNTEFSLKSDVNLFLAMILLTASIISVFCIVDTRKALYLKAGKLTIQQITLKWLCCMAPLEATSTE